MEDDGSCAEGLDSSVVERDGKREAVCRKNVLLAREAAPWAVRRKRFR
jgi:hypothetical protein